MTVRELVKILSELNQDKEIAIFKECGYADLEEVKEYPQKYLGDDCDTFYYFD